MKMLSGGALMTVGVLIIVQLILFMLGRHTIDVVIEQLSDEFIAIGLYVWMCSRYNPK